MSCCCCVTSSVELLEGTRKEQLVREEEEEEDRRSMDMSLLREQYRSSTQRQRRRTQLLLLSVSEDLSKSVSIVPVTQGLTSPPQTATFDPWHIHLVLHRRSCPDTTHTTALFRRPLSPSSESRSRNLSVGSASTSASPCSSFISTTEEDFDVGGSRLDPLSKVDPVQVSVQSRSRGGSREDPGDESVKHSAPRPVTSSDESSVPVLRFSRQLSIGGVGSSSEVHRDQNHYPFPSRKTPRISEAARRLGMYSSF